MKRAKVVARPEAGLVEAVLRGLRAVLDGGGTSVRRVAAPKVAKVRRRRRLVDVLDDVQRASPTSTVTFDRSTAEITVSPPEPRRRAKKHARPVPPPRPPAIAPEPIDQDLPPPPPSRFLSTPVPRVEVLAERDANEKRQNKCSKCFEPGHKATTCGRLLAPPSESSLRQKAARAAAASASAPSFARDLVVLSPRPCGCAAKGKHRKTCTGEIPVVPILALEEAPEVVDLEVELAPPPERRTKGGRLAGRANVPEYARDVNAGRRLAYHGKLDEPWAVRTRPLLAFLGTPRVRGVITIWGRQQGFVFSEIDNQLSWLELEGYIEKRSDGTYKALRERKPDVAVVIGPEGTVLERELPRGAA